MREIENKNIKEKCYMEKLENGLQVIIIPKKEIQKIYYLGHKIWFNRQYIYR